MVDQGYIILMFLEYVTEPGSSNETYESWERYKSDEKNPMLR
jgi:hypothetical protein